jgi:hypothetical protein
LKQLVLLLALSGLVLADNHVMVSSLSGSTQTARPMTISRVFAQGEFPSGTYPQPSLGGSPITPYQVDVKNTWPDGSVKHALISFFLTVPVSGAVVSFVQTSYPCSSGNLVACQAASLNTTQKLLAFKTSDTTGWDAQFELTNGTTKTINARTMLGALTLESDKVRYWMQGPVVTQAIVEDRSSARSQDVGWDTNNPFHPVYVLTFYAGWGGVKIEFIGENPWIGKTEDLTYSISLKTGTSSPPTTVAYSHASLAHRAATRWREIGWAGTAPGAMNIDYNIAYLVSTKAVPNFNLGLSVTSTGINTEKSTFAASDLYNGSDYTSFSFDPGDVGESSKDMTATGGRPEIGMVPSWVARWLYTMDPSLYTIMMGNAETAGSWPIIFRESASLWFDAPTNSVSAAGKVPSLNARPSDDYAMYSWWGGTHTDGGFGFDLSHQPDLLYYPYIVSGDWYFWEGMVSWANASASSNNASTCFYCRNGAMGIMFNNATQPRGWAWAARNFGQTVFMAPDSDAYLGAYLTKILNNNVGAVEGYFNITDGSFYNTSSTSPWYWGRHTEVGACTGPSTACGGEALKASADPNPLRFYSSSIFGYAQEGDAANYLVTEATARYDQPIYELMVGMTWGWMINDLGLTQMAPAYNYMMKSYSHKILGRDYSPWLVVAYVQPVKVNVGTLAIPIEGGTFQTWAAQKAAFRTDVNCGGGLTLNYQTLTGWPNVGSCTPFPATSTGYDKIALAAAAYLTGIDDTDVNCPSGTCRGANALAWLQANVTTSPMNEDPRYAIVPRGQQVSLSPCDLNKDGIVDVVDVQTAINQATGQAACGAADLTHDGLCNVVDVVRVINAALGGVCRVGP